MLTENVGEKRELERMAHALNHPELILADVGILRSVDDKSFVGQCGAEVVIKIAIDFRIRDIRRSSLEAMLAHNYRPPLAGFQVFGKQEDPVGKYFGPHIEHNFIPAKPGRVNSSASPRIGRLARRRETPDQFRPDGIAIGLRRGLPTLNRR